MIEVILQFGTEIILVIVKGNSIAFGNTVYGAQMTTIEGLKLSKEGTIKEFPDLKDNPNWRIEAIGRFKDKIREFKSERQVANYVIEELRKFGYTPRYLQVQGFRKEVIR